MPADDLPPGLILPQATGVRRVLLVAAGLANVGLAYLGWLLPGLPMTPFVLLASYCFARSSPRLQGWLLRTPFFGGVLRDWHAHRGMRPRAKLTAVLMLLTACTLSVLFAPVPGWARGAIAASGLVGLAVILGVVPTVRPDS
jgi:uncharacterized protein